MYNRASGVIILLAVLVAAAGCGSPESTQLDLPEPSLPANLGYGTSATHTPDIVAELLTSSAPTIAALTQSPITAVSPTPTTAPASQQPATQSAQQAPTQTPIPPSPTQVIPTFTPVPCAFSWFVSGAPANSCPDEAAAQFEAAYQPFEHGAMVWRKGRGYIVLPFNPATLTQQGIVIFQPDDLTVYRDTSADVTAPPGLFAPVSGFGFVWRGDVFSEPGYGLQSVVGWATAPEKGYRLTEQSGTQRFQTNASLQTGLLTYISLPDGRILKLSRLAAPNQQTSLEIITP
jgi:hypothetical protein